MYSDVSLKLLLHQPLFSGLPEEEVKALVSAGASQGYADRQMLFSQGDALSHFYIVLSGAVKLFRVNSDGHEKVVELLKSGQTLCEGEILDACHGHRTSAVAVGDVTVIAFPVSWLKNTAKQNSVFALNLLSLIAHQAHMAEVEAEHQATMSAAQLVACFLQRLCVLYDFEPNGFTLPYSKALIASRLGMEQESLSRALAKLKERGIAVEGNKVAIHDLDLITDYVCAFCTVAQDCPTHDAMERKVKGVPQPKL